MSEKENKKGNEKFDSKSTKSNLTKSAKYNSRQTNASPYPLTLDRKGNHNPSSRIIMNELFSPSLLLLNKPMEQSPIST